MLFLEPAPFQLFIFSTCARGYCTDLQLQQLCGAKSAHLHCSRALVLLEEPGPPAPGCPVGGQALAQSRALPVLSFVYVLTH